jgi:hypothetical protein
MHTVTMPKATSEPVVIEIDDATRVSGLLLLLQRSKACYVVAHGAGAGMLHPFMASVATELTALGIATLRYQFPYMEQHSKRPDAPARCHATVRAAEAKMRHENHHPREHRAECRYAHHPAPATLRARPASAAPLSMRTSGYLPIASWARSRGSSDDLARIDWIG